MTLAAGKEVAQVSNKASIHGAMKESVDFNLEAMFVMRNTPTRASTQDTDVGTVFLTRSP